MSTENTQTDVSPSDVSVESTGVTEGTSEVTPAAASDVKGRLSLDELKQKAKESDGKDGSEFTAKPVEDALNEAVVKAEPVIIPASAYKADFKYKAALQEKEVEEFWRPLMKDAGSEKRVKEALTKLDGFDAVKESRESVVQQYESLNSDYQEQTQLVNRVTGAVQRKDLSSAFRQLGVTEQDVYNWTHQQLQMMELPPDQRQALQAAEEQRHQQFETEEKMSKLQSMYEDQAVQARTMQLDHSLSRPEIQNAAQSWDNLTGQPGAFRDLIIQEAQTAYYQNQEDLSAEQAVQRVMQKFGKVVNQNAMSQQAVPQAHTQQAHVPHVPQAKPVIPNITGKGTTPIKKVPRSLDDLKKMAKELNR